MLDTSEKHPPSQDTYCPDQTHKLLSKLASCSAVPPLPADTCERCPLPLLCLCPCRTLLFHLLCAALQVLTELLPFLGPFTPFDFPLQGGAKWSRPRAAGERRTWSWRGWAASTTSFGPSLLEAQPHTRSAGTRTGPQGAVGGARSSPRWGGPKESPSTATARVSCAWSRRG